MKGVVVLCKCLLLPCIRLTVNPDPPAHFQTPIPNHERHFTNPQHSHQPQPRLIASWPANNRLLVIISEVVSTETITTEGCYASFQRIALSTQGGGASMQGKSRQPPKAEEAWRIIFHLSTLPPQSHGEIVLHA